MSKIYYKIYYKQNIHYTQNTCNVYPENGIGRLFYNSKKYGFFGLNGKIIPVLLWKSKKITSHKNLDKAFYDLTFIVNGNKQQITDITGQSFKNNFELIYWT